MFLFNFEKMVSDKRYTEEQVLDIREIHDKYRTFFDSQHQWVSNPFGGEKIRLEPFMLEDVEEAEKVLKKMKKYPIIFEKSIKFIEKEIKEYKKYSK